MKTCFTCKGEGKVHDDVYPHGRKVIDVVENVIQRMISCDGSGVLTAIIAAMIMCIIMISMCKDTPNRPTNMQQCAEVCRPRIMHNFDENNGKFTCSCFDNVAVDAGVAQ